MERAVLGFWRVRDRLNVPLALGDWPRHGRLRITLDSRGIDFSLGTKEEPQELFLAWDRIAAIKHKRVGSAQQYSVVGTDGSQAIFTSYTFFRPKKVARMIAARTGQAIQKA